MRAIKVAGGLVVAMAALTAAVPALAQAGQPSEFDYICKFTPESCMDANAPKDAKERDEQRSFSLTRAMTKPQGVQAVQATAQPRARVGQSPRNAYASTSVQPTPGRARRPAMGVSANDMMMTFVNGSADLTAQARTNATTLAKVMNGPLAGKRFMIEGHTNAVGSADSNYKLSQQRADSLVAFLVGQGVDRTRLEAKGFGFDRTLPGQPKVSAANRRVEAKAIS